MRLIGGNSVVLKSFADWILQIGDGVVGDDEDGESMIEIPQTFLAPFISNPIESIVSCTYPDILENGTNPSYLTSRAILAPTIEDVDMINNYMLSLNTSEEKIYLSSDLASSFDSEIKLLDEIHSLEILNGIRCSGVPAHEIRLKVGVPVMLMRNINFSSGLCNGTRLIVTRHGDNIIEAQILTETNDGKVYIPRLTLTPSGVRLTFMFQRRQLPLVVSYTMTVNKSQGQ
ncbi:unnamed protein product, partial [Cuscuta europaea]